MISDDYFCIGGGLIYWYIRYILWAHDKYCICSFSSRLVVALTHSPKIFTKGSHPDIQSFGILHEFTVACDVLARDGVHHCQAIVFEVLLRCVLGANLEWGEHMLGFGDAIHNEAVDCFLADDPYVVETG